MTGPATQLRHPRHLIRQGMRNTLGAMAAVFVWALIAADGGGWWWAGGVGITVALAVVQVMWFLSLERLVDADREWREAVGRVEGFAELQSLRADR